MLALDTKLWVDLITLVYFPVVTGNRELDEKLYLETVREQFPDDLMKHSPKLSLINPDLKEGGLMAYYYQPTLRTGIALKFRDRTACVFDFISADREQDFPFNTKNIHNNWIWMRCHAVSYSAGTIHSDVDPLCHLEIKWGYSLEEEKKMIGYFLKSTNKPVDMQDIYKIMNAKVKKLQDTNKEQLVFYMKDVLNQLAFSTQSMRRQKLTLQLQKNGENIFDDEQFTHIVLTYDSCNIVHNYLSIYVINSCSSTAGAYVAPILAQWQAIMKEDDNVKLVVEIDINHDHIKRKTDFKVLDKEFAQILLTRLQQMAFFHSCTTQGPSQYHLGLNIFGNLSLQDVRMYTAWSELASLEECTLEALCNRFKLLMQEFRGHIAFLETHFNFIY